MNYVLPIDADDMHRFMETLLKASGTKYALFAFLGMETGLRTTDLLRLRYGAFSARKTELKIKEQKTGKRRTIPITDEMRATTNRLKSLTFSTQRDYIFTGLDGVAPMHRSTVYRHISRAGKLCGLQGVSPHSLRKSYAVQLFGECGDIETVRKSLNHKHSITTIHSYLLAGVNLKMVLDAVKKPRVRRKP